MNRSLSFSCSSATLLLLVCASLWSTALAWGPNAGGTIIVHDPSVVYSNDRDDYCGIGTAPASCATADVRLDGTDPGHSRVFKM
jgi:hypothetical protein